MCVSSRRGVTGCHSARTSHRTWHRKHAIFLYVVLFLPSRLFGGCSRGMARKRAKTEQPPCSPNRRSFNFSRHVAFRARANAARGSRETLIAKEKRQGTRVYFFCFLINAACTAGNMLSTFGGSRDDGRLAGKRRAGVCTLGLRAVHVL